MIKKSKKFITVSVVLGMCLCFLSGYIVAGQPHMQSALSHLRSAKSELQKASLNKGGHRIQALELINRAINQVNKGIAVAD